MRALTLILTMCAFCGNTFAFEEANELQFHEHVPLIHHLKTINQYWDQYENEVEGLNGHEAFASDIERIGMHLRMVANHLKRVARQTSLTDNTYAKRLALIDTLRKYAERKVFPINTRHSARTPYFVDDFGTACAVGYLMLASGGEDLVNRIKEDFNYSWLKDIPIPEVSHWAASHGFSVEELKWIQPGYSTILNARPVGDGTDSSVKCIATYYGDDVFAGGNFTNADGSSCHGMVQLVDSSISCIATGLTGNVNDLVYFGNTLYAAGEFHINGKEYGMVIGTESAFEPVELEQNYEYVGNAVYWINGDGMLAECSVNDPDDCHLWRSSEGIWEKIASIHGYINDIVSYKGKTVGGSFDSITAHYSHGDSTFQANNIARYEPNSEKWLLYPDEVDNEVLTLETVGLYLYVGGRCVDTSDSSHSFCMLSYLNGNFQQVVKASYFYPINSETAIYDITPSPYTGQGGHILFAGNFGYTNTNGTQFSGLATFDPLVGDVKGFGQFDGPVYTVQYTPKGLYIGGQFNSTYRSEPLNNLCLVPVEREEEATHVSVVNVANTARIFPNPSKNSHTVRLSELVSGKCTLELYDVMGNRIAFESYTNDGKGAYEIDRDITPLPKGTYYYVIQTRDQQFRSQFIKD